jgi:hypothetical protein
MKRHCIFSMPTMALAIAAGSALLVTAPTLAVTTPLPYSTDFETATGYDLFFGAVTSTDQAYSGTQSIKLPMAVVSDTPLIRVSPAPAAKLNDVQGTFQAYVPSTSAALAPYMYLGVDTNQNGIWNSGTDDLVIAFSDGLVPAVVPQDAWFLTGLDAATKVHVVGARPGLTAGTYSSSGTQDTLANLRNVIATGSTTWGDLDVLRVYVAAGEWPSVSSYTGYVDNLSVVPEPASMSLFAVAGGLALSRRRRSSTIV